METNDASLDYAMRDGKLKMAPISSERKRELEEMLERPVCPLTAEEISHPLFIGLYLNAGAVHKYFCSVDGGIARGGVPSTIMFFTAIQPCNEEYAKACFINFRYAKAQLHE